ncbi:MAG: hypothetical protein ACD_58C00136G0004 [uncultured bacterium]|nr:MAG: hypothetical protein ACD_58C00136G0004 [uncultured bacterium]
MVSSLWKDENGFTLRSLINKRAYDAAELISARIILSEGGEKLIGKKISAAIIRGSGMQSDASREGFEKICTISFDQFLPFVLPPVFDGGHRRELVILLHKHTGKLVAEFYGRIHYYDVLDQIKATFIIRVLKHLGCQILIILNAAGGCKKKLKIGDFVVLNHGDLTPSMPDPHLGIHPIRFFDPASTYNYELSGVMMTILDKLEIQAHYGALVIQAGTSYESPIERQKLIDNPLVSAAGMSNYNEAMVAVFDTRNNLDIGPPDVMRVIGVSVISNNHTLDQPITDDEVVEVMKATNPKIDLATAALLNEVLQP